MWHYLGTKYLDFRRENNSTPGVLIKEIWYSYAKSFNIISYSFRLQAMMQAGRKDLYLYILIQVIIIVIIAIIVNIIIIILIVIIIITSLRTT